MGETLFRPEIKELSEEKEPRRVVRVFLSQSRSMEEIMRDMKKTHDESYTNFDFTRLFFTNVVWAEKSDKSVQNAGQVMPVGGKVEKYDKGDLVITARREVVEETHLRVLDLQPFEKKVDYRLKTNNVAIDIEQYLFFGRILPTDIPVPLDPQEDKIGDFHKMDLKMMGDLYSEKARSVTGKNLRLLGNLRLPLCHEEKDNKIIRSPEEDEKVVGVFVELAGRSQDAEKKKRESVMKLVQKYLSQNEKHDSKTEVLFQQFFEAKDFFVHQKEFQKLCNDLIVIYGEEDFMDALKTAIEASNFEEEMVLPASQESSIEATLRVIYVLLETKGDYDIFLDIAQKNKSAAPFVQKIIEFIEALTDENDPSTGPEYKTKNLRHKLGSLKELDDDFITSTFCEVFGVDVSNIQSRLGEIDKFLNKLSSNAIIPNGNLGYHQTNIIEITSEIANTSLSTLIRYAFPFGDNSWKENIVKDQRDNEEIKRKVFEARRKLALLYVYTKTDEYYKEIKENGNSPINKLWTQNIVSSKTQRIYIESLNDGKNITDIEVHNDPRDLSVDDSSESEERIGVDVRKISIKGKPSFLAQMKTRVKELDSLYRKIIDRGFNDPSEVKDIYGRLFIVTEDKTDEQSFEYIRRRETRRIRIDGEMKDCDDMAPVLDIMEYLSQQDGIEIVSYTEMPQKDKAFASKGVGGGSDVKLTKFYIKHTDSKGIVRYEEVQIFTPIYDKTAFFWYNHKDKDDKKYYFERLMREKGFHSVLEQLYPTAIYGEAMHDLRMIHTRNKKKNGVKK